MTPTDFEQDMRIEELNDLVCCNPSIFGRLVSIATLREISPEGLVIHFRPVEIQQAVRKIHMDVFTAWLNLSLKQQRADLAIYLARIGANPSALSGLLARCETLIPPNATKPQRDLFRQDLAIAYALSSPGWEKEPATENLAASPVEAPPPCDPSVGKDARAA